MGHFKEKYLGILYLYLDYEYYEKKQENQSKAWILNAEEKINGTKNSDN